MTRQTTCKTVRMEASRSVWAHLDIDRSNQTQAREVLYADAHLETVRGRSGDTWPEPALGAADKPRPWGDGWSVDASSGAGQARDPDCLDETGTVCPALAEARAGRALAERQLIELTHRLANVLQGLAARIERQRRLIDNPALKDELDKLFTSVCATAQLHRCLLPPRNVVDVDLGTLLRHLAAAIEGVTGLLCDVEAEAVIVPGQIAAHLASAVNELAWNAYKHAYGGVEGGTIRIICRRDDDARLLISVADQGCGLPAGFDPFTSQGVGLMVICATALQFSGEVRVDSNRGTRVTLLLSVPACEGGTP